MPTKHVISFIFTLFYKKLYLEIYDIIQQKDNYIQKGWIENQIATQLHVPINEISIWPRPSAAIKK